MHAMLNTAIGDEPVNSITTGAVVKHVSSTRSSYASGNLYESPVNACFADRVSITVHCNHGNH